MQDTKTLETTGLSRPAINGSQCSDGFEGQACPKGQAGKLAKEDRRTLSAYYVEKLLEDYVKSASQVGPEQDRPRAKQA